MPPRRWTVVAFVAWIAAPLVAQTDTVAGGVVGDSSIAAPVVVWNRTGMYGDTFAAGVNGWTLFAERTTRVAPRRRIVASLTLTPLHSHNSDHLYVAGERRPDLDFDDSSIEVTFGRNDTPGERWTSDLRAVALYEHVRGTDPATRDFWSSPYAGLRTRQAFRHITSDDPLQLTFEGSEVAAEAEVFAGKHVWSHVRIDQRASRRFRRIRAGESVTVFHGRSINTVNAFLTGGSWPVSGVRPLYGYRYAELRLDRGAGINGDVQYALRDSLSVAAHGSFLRSRSLVARGVAADMAASWRGIGMRIGIARPFQRGRSENRFIIYGSLLASAFVR